MLRQLASHLAKIIVLAGLVAGCSDDETPTTPDQQPSGLQVTAAATAPVIDGTIETVWSNATAYNITVGSSTTNANVFGPVQVMLKAMTNNNRLYLLAQWQDPSATETVGKKKWQFSGGTWSKSSEDEDRFYVMFDVGNNGTEGANCATMCHQPSAGLMATTGGGNVDVWHWKAARTNPVGRADDKWWDGTGRGSDAKTGSAYSDNLQVVSMVEYPKYMHASDTTAYTGDFLFTADTAAFDSLLDWTGASIPFYFLDSSASGSRWEVEAKGVFSGGTWTLEMSRALNTGNNDDVVLGTGSIKMSIAITDNSGGNHSGIAPFNLLF